MLIDGLYVPLTPPFYRDGACYWKKLEHNVARYSLTPAAGLVALSGEGEALDDDEMFQTLQTVREAAAAEKVLLANVAKQSVKSALRLAGEAAKQEFDAVLLSAPYGLTDAELRLFFAAVADGSELPVLLHSTGSRMLSVEMLADLAQHPQVIGLFDAALSVERYRAIAAATAQVKHEVTVTPVFAPVTRRMRATQSEGAATFVSAEALGGGTALAVAPPKPAMRTRTKTVGFQVMASGAAAGWVDLLQAGVAGGMLPLAACAPQACFEAFAAFKDGDVALAHEKQKRLLPADALMSELGTAGIQYACDWNGYYGGPPRLPRLSLLAGDRAKVERVMAGLRN